MLPTGNKKYCSSTCRNKAYLNRKFQVYYKKLIQGGKIETDDGYELVKDLRYIDF